MNIFEGMRRVSLLIAVVAIISVIVGIFVEMPGRSISYMIPVFNGPALSTDSECEIFVDGHSTYVYKGPTGRSYSTSFCFKAITPKNGAREVPYGDAGKGMSWVADAFSPEVKAYMQTYASKFYPTKTDFEEADGRYLAEVLRFAFARLGWLLLGLLSFYIFTYAIGWIVRGFAGIPKGMDAKPAK